MRQAMKMCGCAVMMPHICKDIRCEIGRLHTPTFNLLREHSITRDQQAAMVYLEFPAMGNPYPSIESHHSI
jgi:hypothetical protein